MENKFYIPRTFIKNSNAESDISENGYTILGNVGDEVLKNLINTYKANHSIKTSDGAMFYSIYSQDIDYRKRVHNELSFALKEVLDKYFDIDKCKNVLNSFIIKSPGEKSEFALHQDSTIIDESRFSQLSLWIPLQDTSLDNGTLCVVPKTHKIFSPYRGNTIIPPYLEYEDELRKYLLPLNLKAGDILAFDYRLVHYSPANTSQNDRVVVLCGLFEKDAEFEVSYQQSPSSNIEIYSQDDDYLLTNKGFHLACDCRPETGVKIREEEAYSKSISRLDFIQFANQSGLSKNEIPLLQKTNLDSFTVIDAHYKPGIKKTIKDKIVKLIR